MNLTTPPSSPSVVTAVVGAGGWGRNHVRNFATMAGSKLKYVCDLNPATQNLVAQYPDVTATTDLRVILDDKSVQAAIVATNAPTHFEVARQLLEAGKDVLVEKPLTLGSESALKLCELAEANKRVLMVGHLLLFHPAVETLKNLIDQGELGEILYVVSQRLNLGVVRKDENAWWSLAPHDVSIANYLLGEEPTAVTATGGVFLQRERGIEDVVFATLHYGDEASSKLAHVHVSWLDPHKIRRLTVVGSKKMAVFDDGSSDQKLTLYDKGAVPPPAAVSYEEGVRVRTGDIVIPALRMTEPLQRECAAFLRAVETREAPLANGRAGLAVVRVLEAGTKSIQLQGKRVETV